MINQRDFTVSVEYIQFIMNLAPRFGIDPAEVYSETGFNPETLETTGARIPFDQFNQVWKAVINKNSDPALGLHLGENAVFFPGHILFLLMLNAPTLKDALEIFCRYFNLMNDINSPIFSTNPGMASLAIRFHTAEPNRTRHIHEGILAAYASVLYRISNNKIQFEGVYFVHPHPKSISEHQRIFNAPVFFDQSENKLVFKKEFLSLPVYLSNKEVLETLERLAQKLQKRLYTNGPWREKVARIIMDMLNAEKPAIESVSRKLAIGPRNLQRALKKEGVTFRKLLDRVRKEQALYFLEDTDIPIREIAFLLGYSEQSIFHRAFQRWVDATPGQYRSRIKYREKLFS